VILRRILFLLMAASALAVSAGVIVIALAYALYALVKPDLGAAGAAAVVAGSAALLIGLIGLLLGALARPPKRKTKAPENVVDRITEFVRDKPVTAIAAAIGAGLLAIRNPKYLGAAIRSFVEGRETRR
jgi:hypothetical protein